MNQMMIHCLPRQLDQIAIGQNGGMELKDEEHQLL